MKKRYIPCNICGAEEYAVLYPDELGDTPPKIDYNFTTDTKKTYQIVRCNACGLVYTNPMPSLSSLYEGVVDKTYLESKRQRVKTAKRNVEKVLKFKQGGKLLDIGCSIGIFLDAASKHFDVEGIETSRWAYSEAAKRHTVYDRPLSELKLQKKYDVVTLFGVIEHFEDPTRELVSIFNALKPGGLFIVYTGDADAWLPRILGKRWWWFQGMHTFYFSKRTCRLLLEKCGFEVISTKTYITYFQLFSLAVSLQRYSFGKIIKPIFNISFLKNLMVPLRINGEMLLFAQKR